LIAFKRLEPGEWGLLGNDEPMPDATSAIALVAVDQEGDLAGRVFLVAPAHIEGIYIDRKWRGSTIMHRLVAKAEDEARKIGLTQLLAFAINETMEDYIARLGYEKLTLTVWQKSLTGEIKCR
jgi:N-acetylglutamate synthase-like GNAT family acetyltransferase